MGEVAEIVGGGTPRTSEPSNWNGDVPWITPADLSGYRTKAIASGARSISKQGLASSGARMLPTGTVLMSSRAPIGYVAIAAIPISTNQGFKSFVLRDGLLPDYVYWYLKRSRDLLNEFASGTTFLEVSGRRAAEIPIPIAPLAEQRRIVAALEEHLSDLDEAVAGLGRAKANLRQYRASLVTAAMSGALSSSEGSPPSKWEDVVLIELADVVSGQTPKGVEDCANDTGEIPWIKVGDMNLEGNEREMVKARAWLSEADAVSLGLHLRPAGTIIFPKRGGAIATNKKRLLGRRAVFDLNTMGLVPRPGLGSWLWWWFQSVDLARLSDGSNVPQINHGDVAPLSVPLPPLEERARLIAILEERLALAERLSLEIDVQLARATRLRQGILKRAFEGKLVPQDPGDEPPTALLTRQPEPAHESGATRRGRARSTARRERS